MTTKWITTKPQSFNDLSEILSRSSGEFLIDFLATSSAERTPPCGHVSYFITSGAILPHDLGLLVRASRADNWQCQFTFKQLARLLIESSGSCIYKAHAKSAETEATYTFEEGKAYYERNKDLLTRKYNGEYIAVWDNEVIDHDMSFSALAQRVYKKLGYISIYMPFVTSKRRVLRFESPRFRRSTAGVS